ncbi:hypothetical protein ACFZBU_25935 [Embleya sp. NPDC008237]|uniref:hypothetical protein n=1 Tax=Embleya sp. NPDC008237 TaxID=3363978 RepID=UPI0036F16D31
MSEKRRFPHRETIQALVGVSVIVIGLLTTLVLHLTHDSDGPRPTPVPVPISPSAPAVPGTSAAAGESCCTSPAPMALDHPR